MSVPESQPLKTWEAVLSWQPGGDHACVASVGLHPDPTDGHRPQVLVCHDMAGGYLEDRFPQGCDRHDSYRFYHWQHVDTFVYFSHYFVTIPPPGWINAAHKHGTKVLGTVITEWDDGKMRCKQFLQSEESVLQFVKKLVTIATYYQFDGWLINIENPIEQEDGVELMQSFVRQLTEQMHSAHPYAQVLWYDSVTCVGELKWQDELNSLNSCFFDACDGIFLNYTWKDQSLVNSAELSSSKGRLHDVYVGVDVFGRNCRGGGGFNTIEAMEAIAEHNLSVAIFAPGWVYEKLGKADFTENENKFWRLLHHRLPVKSVTQIPLVANFCHGQGHKLHLQGKVISESSWCNLSLQSRQPTLTSHGLSLTSPPQTQQSLTQWTQEAFMGGACLKLAGQTTNDHTALVYQLFQTDLQTQGPVLLLCSYKPLQAGTHCAVLMEAHTSSGPGSMPDTSPQHLPTKKFRGDVQLQAVEPPQVTEMLDGYQLPLQANGWTTGVYESANADTLSIKSIMICLTSEAENAELSILLGQILLFKKEELKIRPVLSNLQVSETQIVKGKSDMFFSCQLTWDVSHNVSHYIVSCQTSQEDQPQADKLRTDHETETEEVHTSTSDDPSWRFMGVAHTQQFCVHKLALCRDVLSITFRVQIVAKFGLLMEKQFLFTCSVSVND